MAKPKMIVVWGSEDILSSSIEHFLASKEDWKVVRASKKEDLEALLLAVENTNPDIVIIYREESHWVFNLPLQPLLDHPAIKVITISLENNEMHVYSKQNICVKEASDLIAAIEDVPSPNIRPAGLGR